MQKTFVQIETDLDENDIPGKEVRTGENCERGTAVGMMQDSDIEI